ncbi:MAG: hypothetical protein J0M03_18635 [Acidobacteria bacterium]|nr:hypothetical protein [Acidobacteriota bacterium]
MLKIKKEKFAEKCEICHKKDLFNPVNNSCGRCEKLIISRSDKGKFIVNWQVDLVLLANTLRNFAWQNLDIRSIKIVRLVLFISMLFLIFAPIADQEVQQYYQIASLPMPDGECQTEDFPIWGMCGRPYLLIDVQIGLLFSSIVGLLVGIVAYYSPENEKAKLISLGR